MSRETQITNTEVTRLAMVNFVPRRNVDMTNVTHMSTESSNLNESEFSKADVSQQRGPY